MAKKKQEPTVDNEVGKIKVKNKPKVKKFTQDNEPIKVNLTENPQENETKEEVTNNNTNDTGVVEVVEDAGAVQEQKEVQPEVEAQETPVVEEITDEEINEQVEDLADEAEQAITKSMETGSALPENIQKLVDFMEETGGNLNDYVRLNQDYSELNENQLLKEYYSQTKPHLSSDEIEFMLEDQFNYDEELETEIEIKRKKLALKEQVAEAKQHLDGAKSKYYEEIKAGSKLTKEQQKAIDFFNRYNKESEELDKAAQHSQSVFTKKTDEVFNKNFKGFEYNVGDKKFRFNVKDVDNVKQVQSDITNFTKKFLDKNSTLTDAKGYHKSMFTAMNPDAVANHFYEQGKADALKDSIAKSKNIDMSPRQSHGVVEAGGIKVKVLGDSSNDFKFKIKNK
tara:strand:+ start:881 stop:2068 length:1188 start_codon:yes stop_codon:yes gene_type:complete